MNVQIIAVGKKKRIFFLLFSTRGMSKAKCEGAEVDG